MSFLTADAARLLSAEHKEARLERFASAVRDAIAQAEAAIEKASKNSDEGVVRLPLELTTPAHEEVARAVEGHLKTQGFRVERKREKARGIFTSYLSPDGTYTVLEVRW